MNAMSLRRALFVAALAFYLSPGPSVAFGAEGVSIEATGDAREYRVAPGDRLSVTVIGQPDLSGDFMVDGVGNILLPIVGTISVGNLTVAECQDRVTNRLADGVLRQSSVFVRISEFRPVQVLGEVRSPGGYPFRFGTVVKNVVAQAGGYGTAQRSAGDLLSDFLEANSRVESFETKRLMLLLRVARLRAQIGGDASFEPPRQFNDNTDARLAQMMKEEKEAFAISNEAYANQIELARKQRPQLVAETAAITSMIATERKQLGLLQEHFDEYAKLEKKGLARASAIMDLKISLFSRESNIWRLEAEQSRSRNNVVAFDLKLLELENVRRRDLLADLQSAWKELHEVDMALPAAKEIRAVKSSMIGEIEAAEISRSIKISRTLGDKTSTFEASESTVLAPGDIIEVLPPRVPTGERFFIRPKAEVGGVKKRFAKVQRETE